MPARPDALIALEIQSAALALPQTGPASLLSLGGAGIAVLWATTSGPLQNLASDLEGCSPVERFHRALGLAAALLGTDDREWRVLTACFDGPALAAGAAVHPGWAPHFAPVHRAFTDGIAAALLDEPRGEEPAFGAAHDRVRRLFFEHGSYVRSARREAEAQADEGLCDTVRGNLDPLRWAREPAYRVGEQRAGLGADPRGASVRIEARAQLQRSLCDELPTVRDLQLG